MLAQLFLAPSPGEKAERLRFSGSQHSGQKADEALSRSAHHVPGLSLLCRHVSSQAETAPRLQGCCFSCDTSRAPAWSPHASSVLPGPLKLWPQVQGSALLVVYVCVCMCVKEN